MAEPPCANRARRRRVELHVCCVAAALALSVPVAAAGVTTPEIRTSPQNPVPQCVTPQRLMAFLKKRNSRLDPRFENIASWYKRHGEAWRVRWDYAFFQMAIETNFLTYKTGKGRWGDVDPRQNNFAGLGTTGGGVPGDSYPDVKTGVLAQLQHLVVYSGERLADPVGPRTKLKQDDILEVTARVRHPMTFADLARRWAVDKRYGASIEWVAKSYRTAYCSSHAAEESAEKKMLRPAVALGGPPVTKPASRTAPVRTIWSRASQGLIAPKPVPARARSWAPAQIKPSIPTAEPLVAAAPESPVSQPGGPASACKVLSASYGGHKTLLLRSQAANEVRYTALTVLDGFERSMLENYVRAYAPGGSSIGEFETKDAALAKAKELCAGTAQAPGPASGPRAG